MLAVDYGLLAMVVSVAAGPAKAGTPTGEMGCGRVG